MSITGHCYCRQIEFTIEGSIRPIAYCHCSQCRKISGHYVAASACEQSALSIHGQPRWFSSSAGYERAFCPSCGTALFWRKIGSNMISIMAGAFREGTPLQAREHICVADKADYYSLDDGLPQYAGAPDINRRDQQATKK